MVVSMMQTLVVPILGIIERDLHTTVVDANWLTTATLLSAAICTPLFGRFGDQYGTKPMLIGVLALALAGSVLAAISTALPWLIVARALQGSATAIFPLAQSVLRDRLPPERLPGAMGLVSGTLAFGTGVALVGAGLLTRGPAPDYHRVFWMAAGVSALALLAVAVVVPPSRATPGGPTDWLGALTLAAMLTLLLLPLSRGSIWGWSSGTTLGCFAGAAVMAAVWALVEHRSREPLVDMRMLVVPHVLFANLAGLLLGFAMFSQFLGVSALVQIPAEPDGYGFGATVLQASVGYLMPSAMASLIAARAGGALVRRIGAHQTLAAGAACGAAGFAVLAVAHGTTCSVVVAGVLVGVAVSFGFATLPAVLLGSVPSHRTGIANGINSVFRSVGSSLASALIGTLLMVKPAEQLTPGASILPSEGRFTWCFCLAAGAFVLVVVLALAGLWRPAPAGSPRLRAVNSRRWNVPRRWTLRNVRSTSIPRLKNSERENTWR
jgi:MFS family permease